MPEAVHRSLHYHVQSVSYIVVSVVPSRVPTRQHGEGSGQ